MNESMVTCRAIRADHVITPVLLPSMSIRTDTVHALQLRLKVAIPLRMMLCGNQLQRDEAKVSNQPCRSGIDD